jgi:hypothetical protein
MLLRKLNAEGGVEDGIRQVILVSGQLCLVVGILLGRLSREVDGRAWFGLQISDFWQGLLAGFAAVLIGASIPLNLTALRRWRGRDRG